MAFGNTPDMVCSDLYAPYHIFTGIQKYIGGRACNAFCKGHGGPAVQNAIRLVHPGTHRHTPNQEVLPHIREFDFQGFHQRIFTGFIANRQYFFFVLLHPFVIFAKVSNSLRKMDPIPQPNPMETAVTYEASHPYARLNIRTDRTRTVWMAFHGIGQLARYFVRQFSHLDPDTNYILAPQAPSLYYLSDAYTRVGACWLTRERTQEETENLLGYLDALAKTEGIGNESDLRLVGYSQGVSVLCRWVARRRIPCKRIILYAGRVPEELRPEDFSHLSPQTRVDLLLGSEDPYLAHWDPEQLTGHARGLFGDRLNVVRYHGGHEFQGNLIS